MPCVRWDFRARVSGVRVDKLLILGGILLARVEVRFWVIELRDVRSHGEMRNLKE